MEKKTKRKAFNFLRSYFDVLNELEKDEDKLSFLLSIINKQFLNEDPEDLSFIANLCYKSQKHSIEKSVKGWLVASGTDLQGNITQPSILPKGLPLPLPTKEEQEQEEEQEKEEDEVKEIDHEAFLDLDVLIDYYLNNEQIVNAVISLPANKVKDKEHLKDRMQEFKQALIEQGRVKETFKEFAKYFRNWNCKVKQKEPKATNAEEYHKSLRKNIAF